MVCKCYSPPPRRGLNEALSSAQLIARPCAYSPAPRRGLIEASSMSLPGYFLPPIPRHHAGASLKRYHSVWWHHNHVCYSPAPRRGLIEAAQLNRPLHLAGPIPRHHAGASLKLDHTVNVLVLMLLFPGTTPGPH